MVLRRYWTNSHINSDSSAASSQAMTLARSKFFTARLREPRSKGCCLAPLAETLQVT